MLEGQSKKTHNRVGSMISFLKNQKIEGTAVDFEIKVCRQRSMMISCPS
jgi:hypothetical protein